VSTHEAQLYLAVLGLALVFVLGYLAGRADGRRGL